uniref:ATPase family AAA domain-containing protein 2 n=1 Tax=Phallusia mammillata TaxID=59560 RepID=A0A6F9D7J7_9ASCI|nr:ATPase family AAA domain-containing protein 2 [Phallusia mammillata]
MVLTRRSGGKLPVSPKHEPSMTDEEDEDDDEDFPSIKTKTRSSGRFSHSFNSGKRKSSRDDHKQLNTSRMLSRISQRNIKHAERENHQRSLRSIGLDDEGSSCEEEDVMDLRISPSRGVGYPTKIMPRRSTRNRKTHFETLNIGGMEAAAMEHDILDFSESKHSAASHRHSVNPELRDLLVAQGKDPNDTQGGSQPDIYSTIKARHRLRRPRRYFDDFELSTPKKDARDAKQKGEQEDEEGDEEEESDDEEQGNDEDDEQNEENDAEEDDHEEELDRRYSLRTKRAQPLRLIYELQRQTRPQPRGLFDHLPRSPARRKTRIRVRDHTTSPYRGRRRRTNSQGASSSDSTSSSDDEKKFERRKKRSMMKARNRCLPMNISQNDLAQHGFSKERRNIGSSLADIDPMQVDKSTMFSSVGGHQKHIRALKEMVVFPLLYPEVFQRFHITPPRGCLFYGPPGTGKTLMARALANECSIEGKRVAFFMRKGADCLSKWVGESERQLRLLFDQAYQMRPAIIFFDEIDGLAPVRSSRQDQIHSSIVSTLLALMDGLDSRGEIIVIGATNRIDSIDPALRRPGRFDREFMFSLPDQKARLDILRIHTSKWNPPLSESLLHMLSERTVGYCGADIKSACTEAAIAALRRRYPQIYASNEKLKLDVTTIEITAGDFLKSMQTIVPTARRSANNPTRALNPMVQPLLMNTLLNLIEQLVKVFPIVQNKSKLLQSRISNTHSSDSNLARLDESDSEFDMPIDQTWTPVPTNGLSLPTSHLQQAIPLFSSLRNLTVCRPRLLLCGPPCNGQSTHLAPALLHDIEGFSFHLLDIPSMYGLSSHTPEEACAQVFREACRTAPSVIYIPNCVLWWEAATDSVRSTFQYLLNSLPASAAVLLIATAECPPDQIPSNLLSFFSERDHELFCVKVPTADERTLFFAPVFLQYAVKPPSIKSKQQSLEVLEKAEPPAPTRLTEGEVKRIEESEQSTLRSLRLFLRDVLTRLARDRRFKAFLKPVDTEEVPDYTEVISQPMDLSTMVTKIDQHKYGNVKNFLDDIDLICSNALEYNPDHCAEDKAIRHRACLLKDMAYAIIDEDLDPNFERMCNDVQKARMKRRADPSKYAPSFYRVLPRNQNKTQESNSSGAKEGRSVVQTRSSNVVKTPRRRSKPRRKRSSWASGIVSKRKRKKLEDHTNNEHKDEETAEEEHSENKDEEEPEEENEEKENSKTENNGEGQSAEEATIKNVDTVDRPVENGIESMKEDVIARIEIPDDSIDVVVDAEKAADEVPADIDILGAENVEEKSTDVATKPEQNDDAVMVNGDNMPMEISEDKIMEEIETQPSQKMMLRSRTKSCSENEVTNLQPPPPPVTADHHKLKCLLTKTVAITSSACVEDLEKLYSILMRCVYKHRQSYDKTELIQDLEKTIQQVTNQLQRADSGFPL